MEKLMVTYGNGDQIARLLHEITAMKYEDMHEAFGPCYIPTQNDLWFFFVCASSLYVSIDMQKSYTGFCFLPAKRFNSSTYGYMSFFYITVYHVITCFLSTRNTIPKIS
jgi:hypothetical protein